MKKVLFICVGNACRSAMAEKLANSIFFDLVAADSAGVHPLLPDIRMDDQTITSMNEVGIDISKHSPKHVSTITGEFDLVVNMSRMPRTEIESLAPNLKTNGWLEWEVSDPRGKPVRAYRAVRDELFDKIFDLLIDVNKPQ